MSIRRTAALALLTLYILFILDLAWLQFPSRYPAPNMVPLRSMIGDWKAGGRELIVNFAGNIVAFIPIGMMPALARPRGARAWHAAGFSLGLSAMIEAVQYMTGRRVADVDDLILNTAGGVLGYGLLWLLSSRNSRPVDPGRKRPAGSVSTHPDGPQ